MTRRQATDTRHQHLSTTDRPTPANVPAKLLFPGRPRHQSAARHAATAATQRNTTPYRQVHAANRFSEKNYKLQLLRLLTRLLKRTYRQTYKVAVNGRKIAVLILKHNLKLTLNITLRRQLTLLNSTNLNRYS